MPKSVAIGFEDIKEIIDKDRYYIDKTHMIRDLIDKGGKVNLFVRPRRFGKTLNLSMIRRFFEQEIDSDGSVISNGYLFDNLDIASCGEKYMAHQGKYPVINLSLKSSKQPDYQMAYACLAGEIAKEYRRHAYILSCENLLPSDKKRFLTLMEQNAAETDYITALDFLSACLGIYHKQKVLILIDEYDVPLENASLKGFYGKMTDFIRPLFESALKTNPYLEFAVITGCLRISRESIFTGLNNLSVYSILNSQYADSFGFTQDEVKQLLASHGRESKFAEVKKWYNGYRFGNQEIYNPWSILNYAAAVSENPDSAPYPYWSNTSSNSIIKELVERADFNAKQEIEHLISGGMIQKPVHEDITYEDIYESQDNLWNFLYFTGYLKAVRESFSGDTTFMDLMIPNTEVLTIYKRTILAWFDRKMKETDRSSLIKFLETGDTTAFETYVSDQLLNTISFFDYAENYYHGFLAGLFKGAGNYLVMSNRECAEGRPDLILKTPSVRGMAFILEIKTADAFQKMEQTCQKALQQIEERNYASGLYAEGYVHIKKYGVCFYRKECMIKAGNCYEAPKN